MRIALLLLLLSFNTFAQYGQTSRSRFRENVLGLMPVPTVQANGYALLGSTSSTSTFTWNNGDGANRIVLMKSGSAVDRTPANGTSYTASNTFGSGTQIGTGNYVVNIGSGSVTVTGLTPATTYYIAIFEFNGTSTQTHYLQTNPATGSTPTAQVAIHVGLSPTFNVFMHSYGLSTGASGPAHYLPNVIAAGFAGSTVINNSLGGRGILRMCQLANQDATVPNSATSTMIIMCTLNDERRMNSIINTRNKVVMTHTSMIFNQYKSSTVSGGHASVTRTGSHAGYAASTAGGKYGSGAGGATSTTTSGGSWNYTFTDPTIAVQLIGTDGVSNTYGQVKVEIDNVQQSLLNSDETTKTTADMNGWYDGTGGGDVDISAILGPVIYIWTGLSGGSHTIKVTTLNTNRVVVDFFGHMNVPASTKPVNVGLENYLPAGGYSQSPSNGSTAGADALNAKIKQVTAFFASRGYGCVWTDMNLYVNTTTDMNADLIHLNDTGYDKAGAGFLQLTTAGAYPAYPQDTPMELIKLLIALSLVERHLNRKPIYSYI